MPPAGRLGWLDAAPGQAVLIVPVAGGGARLELDWRLALGAGGAAWLVVEGHGTLTLIDVEASGVERRALDDPPFGLRSDDLVEVRLDCVTVAADRLASIDELPALLRRLLVATIQISIAATLFDELAEYVRTRARPAMESDVERAGEEPHTLRRLGELVVALHAAEQSRTRATESFERAADAAAGEDEAGAAALAVAEAAVLAAEVAELLTAGMLELAGAGATDERRGFDRPWRDAKALRLLIGPPADGRELGARLLDAVGTEAEVAPWL